MAQRWESRVQAAERVRFEATAFGRILAAFGLSDLWTQRVRFGKQRVFFVAWALTPRTLKLVAGGLVAAWVLTAVVTVTVLAVAAAHFG